MTKGRARSMQAKIEVVKKAATDTPQRPVVEVWEIAKVAKPTPGGQPQAVAQKPVQPESLSLAPAPVVPQSPVPLRAGVAGSQSNQPASPAPTPATPGEQTTPTPTQRPESHPAPLQDKPQLQHQAGPPSQPASTQPITPSQPLPGLPNRPPQGASHPAVGTGPGVLRALQSGLPVARGGRGRGAQAGQ